jgi:hypothetical protein
MLSDRPGLCCQALCGVSGTCPVLGVSVIGEGKTCRHSVWGKGAPPALTLLPFCGSSSIHLVLHPEQGPHLPSLSPSFLTRLCL